MYVSYDDIQLDQKSWRTWRRAAACGVSLIECLEWKGNIKRTRGGGTGALDVFLRQCGGVNSIDLLASLLFLPRRFCFGEANLRRPQPMSVCGAPIDEARSAAAVRCGGGGLGGLPVEA